MSNIKYETLYDLACEYHRGKVGRPWENLFDFMNEVSYSQVYNHFEQLVQLFSKYMSAFGMFRGSINLNSRNLAFVLRNGEKAYRDYLLSPNDTTFTQAWLTTWDILESHEIANTPTVITKLLMGFGGRTPAFDSRFRAAMTTHPLLLTAGVHGLVNGLKDLGRPQLHTHNGNNPIPWERTLDMALWMDGGEMDHWLAE